MKRHPIFRAGVIPATWQGALLHVTALATFGLATLGASMAQSSHKPISAALIYVVGVTVIGALTGLRGGLLAGVAASVIHNFFLSEPVLQFGAASADDYSPLLAFNLTALLSGGLAGRLNDRAVAAEDAQARIKLLLLVSSRLQNATDMESVVRALNSENFPIWLVNAQFYDLEGKGISSSAEPFHSLARFVITSGQSEAYEGALTAHLLSTGKDPLAVVIFPGIAELDKHSSDDVATLLTLLALALERIVLLEQQAEAVAVRRSEEFKAALLASMSHDMRSPLAAIAASASGLASYGGQLDETVRKQMLRTIEDQCTRLNRYTANLLNMAELQSGIGPGRFAPIDILEILGAVLATIRARSPSHVIHREFRCVEAVVLANAVMAEQMLFNILDNAVRYSPSESHITVLAAIEQETVAIVISDEGPGIPQTDLPHIFDRFYRAASAATIEGQGLGLSIAKGFAQAFGGDVEVKSPAAASGTQFMITLPLAGGAERRP